MGVAVTLTLYSIQLSQCLKDLHKSDRMKNDFGYIDKHSCK